MYAVFCGGVRFREFKTGYRFLHVDLLILQVRLSLQEYDYAGRNFGIDFASIREKKVMIPDKEILKYAVPVCLAQTVGQYFFFYIGVANTSGVKGGIHYRTWKHLLQFCCLALFFEMNG